MHPHMLLRTAIKFDSNLTTKLHFFSVSTLKMTVYVVNTLLTEWNLRISLKKPTQHYMSLLPRRFA